MENKKELVVLWLDNHRDPEVWLAKKLDAIGVIANVWPQAQPKPDGLRNCAIFNPANVRIVKRERIEVEYVKGKYVLIPGTRKEV